MVPSGQIVRSLPILLVANRASQAGLQNSANLGRNAALCVEGMQSSKKFVRHSGAQSCAILTFAHTVKMTS